MQTWLAAGILTSGQTLIMGEANGHGRADLVNHGVPSGTWLVSASDGTAFGAAQAWLHNFATGYDWEAVSGGNVGGP